MRVPTNPMEHRPLEERGPSPKRWGAGARTSAGVGQESAGPVAPEVISEGQLLEVAGAQKEGAAGGPRPSPRGTGRRGLGHEALLQRMGHG